MRIGEVARRSGVSARMLRHYESLGLLEPSQRNSNGYREYSPADIGRIFHIEGLRKLGMTLGEVGSALADPDFDPRTVITELITQSRGRIAAEQELLENLERIEELRPADGEALLLSIDLMRSLESRDVFQRHKAALGSGVDGAVPVESLSRAVLGESVLNAAGAMRWALAKSGPEAVRYLVEGMREGSTETRRNAVRALDEIRRNSPAGQVDAVTAAAITEAMRLGLGDTDTEVRTTAALILGRMRDPAALADLFEMAIDGPKDIDAAEALASFVIAASSGAAEDAGPSERVLAELRRLARSAEATVRFRVLQVLIEIPGPEIDDFIDDFTVDPEPEVAVTAKAVLQRRRADCPASV